MSLIFNHLVGKPESSGMVSPSALTVLEVGDERVIDTRPLDRQVAGFTEIGRACIVLSPKPALFLGNTSREK